MNKLNKYSSYWIKFLENKRNKYSLFIFSFIFILSLFAEVISNDKPLVMNIDDKLAKSDIETKIKNSTGQRMFFI